MAEMMRHLTIAGCSNRAIASSTAKEYGMMNDGERTDNDQEPEASPPLEQTSLPALTPTPAGPSRYVMIEDTPPTVWEVGDVILGQYEVPPGLAHVALRRLPQI